MFKILCRVVHKKHITTNLITMGKETLNYAGELTPQYMKVFTCQKCGHTVKQKTGYIIPGEVRNRKNA